MTGDLTKLPLEALPPELLSLSLLLGWCVN